MKMIKKKTRLSSKRALEVLKFLVKKKLGATGSKWSLRPYSDQVDDDDFDCHDWCNVSVDIIFGDSKGFTTFINVVYDGYGQQLLETRRSASTWATLLSQMEREANSLKKAAIFRLGGCNIFEPGDSIESLLVEMTLENWQI